MDDSSDITVDLTTALYDDYRIEPSTRLEVKPEPLDDLIKKKDENQDWLAKNSGISQSRISGLKNGKVPHFEALEAYALALALDGKLEEIAVLPLHAFIRFTPSQFDDVTERIFRIGDVKTLFAPKNGPHLTGRIDESDSNGFYFRTRLIRDQESSEAFEVNSLQDLGPRPALIMGEGGQGKSIFLRYLAIKTFQDRTSMPLFFELRKFKKKKHEEISVRAAISERLQSLGFPSDESQLNRLLRYGRLSLIFDSFDELEQSYRTTILDQLEDLSDDFPESQIVLSSRSHSGIEHRWSVFDVFNIETLHDDSRLELLRRYRNDEEVEEISEHLRPPNPRWVEDLLSTPLMILFFAAHFRRKKCMPKTEIAFYKGLPDLLLRQHNESEGGTKREIKSGLDPGEVRVFLEALCYLLRQQHPEVSVQIADLENAAAGALKLAGLRASPHTVLDDVVRITSLIVDDGDGYFRFIHERVREFFTASYIKNLPQEDHREYYFRMLNEWRMWPGELSFLENIDRAMCIERFLIPDITRLSPITDRTVFESFCVLELRGRVFDANGVPSKIEAVLLDCDSYCCTYSVAALLGHTRLEEVLKSDLADRVLPRLHSGGTVRLDRRLPFSNGDKPAWDVSLWIKAYDVHGGLAPYFGSKLRKLQTESQLGDQ